MSRHCKRAARTSLAGRGGYRLAMDPDSRTRADHQVRVGNPIERRSL